jgi:hypothetical protein
VLIGTEDVELNVGGVIMSEDKKHLISQQEDGTYIRILEDGSKETLTHQQVLEMIFEMDPVIHKAAKKLDQLSKDPDVIRQFEERDAKHLDKEWDEIEKVVDQNGGHYVLPTKPGSVDTTAVSEFIKKQKEQSKSNKND